MLVIPRSNATRDLLSRHRSKPLSRQPRSLAALGMTGKALGMTVLVAVLTRSAQAQAVATIDSAMTQQQVIERLGPPLSVRTFGASTFLLYKNGCEKTCGMSDIVILDADKVVDAVFRSPARRYTRKSSAPKMIPASEARRGAAPPAPVKLPKVPPTPPKAAAPPT